MSEKLTVKELKFVAGIIQGKSQEQSALDAGYAKSSASTQGNRLMQKDRIKGEIEKQISGQGWTPEKVIGELQSLYYKSLEAESFSVAKDTLVLLGRHVGILRDERHTKTEVSHSFEMLLDKAKDITPEPLQINDSRTMPVYNSQEKDTPHVN